MKLKSHLSAIASALAITSALALPVSAQASQNVTYTNYIVRVNNLTTAQLIYIGGIAYWLYRTPANIRGAGRESSVGNKVIKATTGISVRDIKKHGIWGGPNSFFRKPFG